MTYRAKPVVRTRRRPWEGADRRNFLTNLGFGLVVVVAVLVLAVAAAASWYNDHLASVASVDGESINKDDLNRRLEIETLRLSLAESRIADEVNAGRLTDEQGQAQMQFIEQRRQQLVQIALERLIDAKVQAKLAAQEGIQVTDADIDASLTEEATRQEQREAWVIEVEPKVEGDATEPTAAAKTEAKRIADKALADIKGGKDWETVAKDVSTASSAPIGGSIGWITEDFDFEQPFLDALFALDEDGITDVIEGEDGIYRIGRVTGIAEESVDANYQQLIADRGVPIEQYRAAIRDDLNGDKLREKIEAAALAEGPQRHVEEIFLENNLLPEAVPQDSVKTRHILFAPKDDPQGAAELEDDDPAWDEAEKAAKDAYDEIKADPEKFDELARELSDEQGADISGGKLPWFDPSSSLDEAFKAAIFKDGLEPGQLLEPVKSSFGWRVIQIMYFPTDVQQAERLKTQIEDGADFAQLARDYSYGEEAADGGDIGWIAKYQVDEASEAAIFATPIGELTDPVAVDGDGVHLYRVLEEETRTPEGDQRDAIEQSAFTNWYQAKKAGFDITRDAALTGAG